MAHGPQLPPQSASVSSPFFLPSSHAGALQYPLMHALFAQSASERQLLPSTHFPHAPPQSTSDSLPDFLPSVHESTGVPASASITVRPGDGVGSSAHPAAHSGTSATLKRSPESPTAYSERPENLVVMARALPSDRHAGVMG
jgi:hypothetical protein